MIDGLQKCGPAQHPSIFGPNHGTISINCLVTAVVSAQCVQHTRAICTCYSFFLRVRFFSRLFRSEPNLAPVVKTSPLTRCAPTPTEFSLSTTRWRLSGQSSYSNFPSTYRVERKNRFHRYFSLSIIGTAPRFLFYI